MASVTATYIWADGDSIQFDVVIENDYPDAMSHARATAVQAIRDITGMNTPVDLDADPEI